MVLPCRGVLELDIAGRGGRIERDCAAAIGIGERHAFSASGATNRFLVLDIPATGQISAVTSGQLEDLSQRRYVTLAPAAHYLIGYAEQICGLTRSVTEGDSRLTSLWLELLLETLRPRNGLVLDRPARSLVRAKTFMDRSFDQPIKMEHIARAAGLGASRVYELFQQHLGTTPRCYLAEVRLRHALTLLANTRLSIAEIAFRTGHADQSTLTRHLHRACGITPAAYRRALLSRATLTGEDAKSGGEQLKKG